MSEQISTPMDPASSMEADIEDMTKGMFEGNQEPAPPTSEPAPAPETPPAPSPETNPQEQSPGTQAPETDPAPETPAQAPEQAPQQPPAEPVQEGAPPAAPFLTAGSTVYNDQAAAVQGVLHKDEYIGQLRGENDQFKQYSGQAETFMQTQEQEIANLKAQLENTTKANEQGRQLTQEEIDQANEAWQDNPSGAAAKMLASGLTQIRQEVDSRFKALDTKTAQTQAQERQTAMVSTIRENFKKLPSEGFAIDRPKFYNFVKFLDDSGFNRDAVTSDYGKLKKAFTFFDKQFTPSAAQPTIPKVQQQAELAAAAKFQQAPPGGGGGFKQKGVKPNFDDPADLDAMDLELNKSQGIIR